MGTVAGVGQQEAGIKFSSFGSVSLPSCACVCVCVCVCVVLGMEPSASTCWASALPLALPCPFCVTLNESPKRHMCILRVGPSNFGGPSRDPAG
jgi:hypothetical protein